MGSLTIHFYALCVVVGAVAGVALTAARWQARGGTRETVYDAFLVALPCGVVGARVYHVLTDYQLYWGSHATHPWWAIFKIWEGGLGIWGAIAGGVLGAVLYCRFTGIPLSALLDAAAPGVVLAQGIGRLGNWFNQELYGKPTEVPWALEVTGQVNGVSTGEVLGTFHPTFLYEMLWDFLVVVIIVLLDRWLVLNYGRLFACYAALYCCGRFVIEFMRSDYATMVWGMRINNWVSLLVCVVALAFVVGGWKGRQSIERAVSLSEDASQ